MLKTTERLPRPLLRLQFPSGGRHRSTGAAPLTTAPTTPRSLGSPVPDGTPIGLVRPYLVAHEGGVERERRHRRRARLVLLPQGIDLPGVVA